MTKALNYDQIASGPGYTQATMFGLIGFLLMSMAQSAGGAPRPWVATRNPDCWN